MKRRKELVLVGSLCVTLLLTIPLMVTFAEQTGNTNLGKESWAPKSKIIKTCGKGFLEEKANGLKVMHLNGTAYERGFQRAVLLGKRLDRMIKNDITQVSLGLTGGDYEKGLAKIQELAEINKPFIPHKFRQEMQGISDGLAALGSNLTYEDLVLHAISDDIFMMDISKPLTSNAVLTGFPPARCSSFSAYGNATQNGKLIFGGNEDYFETEEVLKNGVAVVVDPTDGGYGYTGGIWNLWFGSGGMNEAGITIKAHLSFVEPETLRGIVSDMLISMVLQYSNSVEDAIDILAGQPRTCGIIVHVADGKTNRSAVIEYTAYGIAVRYPEFGKNLLWSTNHFNCYPGWQGYTGYNMVPYNAGRLGMEDISTVEKWQDSLEKLGIGRNGRYGRLQQLLNENFGKINVDKAQEIMSDRYDMKTGKVISPEEPIGDLIAAYNPDWVMSNDVIPYKSNKRGKYVVKPGTVFSFVASPSDGKIWWAVGDVPPVQYTAGYKYMNLHEELRRNR